jgi:5-methylcytosine-specific restriction protein B
MLQLTITKAMIIDTMKIAQVIHDSGLEGEPLSRREGNQEKYQNLIKPEIQKFIDKYGDAPQQILNEFLRTYLSQRHLGTDFTSAGKQFYTQVVNSHTWACINNKDTSNLKKPHSQSSQYPQLYVLIDYSRLVFGFCYGFHIPDGDEKIEGIKKQDSLFENLLNLLRLDTELKVCYEIDSKPGESPYQEIKVNSIDDLKKNWSRNILILKIFSSDDNFENIEQKISDCFDNLLEILKFTSLNNREKKSINTESSHPVSAKYWQIAPGPQASAWSLSVEKGIIPIFFKDVIGTIPDEILNFSKDQLIAHCKKNAPQLREGQIGARVGSIWDFIHTVQIGDYILANKGQSLAVGWGEITSEAKICRDGSDFSFYRHVDWKEPELNRKLDPDLGRHFFTTILSLKKEQFDSVVFPQPNDTIPGNPLFAKIQNILDYKKQVILYGPPGTGKTWAVSKFVEGRRRYEPEVKTIFTDKKFFWFSANPSFWDPNNLWKGGETELTYGSIRSSFNDIEQGDLIFVYVSKDNHRMFGIATCSKKAYDTNGIPKVFIKGLQPITGPQWADMKDDSVLSNAKPVRMGARGTLFPLDQYEGLRILELAKVTPESIGISLTEQKEKIDNCTFVTFHPSYSYEEFIEGLRPEKDENGNIYYKVQEGIFKRACRIAYNALLREAEIEAEWDSETGVPHLKDEQVQSVQDIIDLVPVYFVIDEINRGDISRIFGELITLIEADKRLFSDTKIPCILPYSKQEFGIPPNLYIIGTMNTADRSISLMDIALRRRFGFCELIPDYPSLENCLLNEEKLDPVVKERRQLAINVLKAINYRLQEKYDRDHQIGHSYLIKISEQKKLDETDTALENIWKYEILPLLQEYFFDSPDKLLSVLNDRFYSRSGTSFTEKPEENFIAALQAVAQQKQGN